MKNQACATIIGNALHKQPGVVSVRPDFQTHQVTVTFNSMVIAKMNIEFIIADAGFDANDTEASPTAIAKLPPECR